MDYRRLFEGIEEPVRLINNKGIVPILFDNGATTPAFKEIAEKVSEWLKYYGPIGRGTGQKGDWSSIQYNAVKQDILHFFGVDKDPSYSVVYTKGATEGINLLAHTLVAAKEDRILVSRMEHHANDLPWRQKGTVQYVDVDQMGRIQPDAIEKHLHEAKGKIKYVALTAASNVTGYVNEIHKIARICHRYNAMLVVDAAQLVAHQQIKLLGSSREEAIDFLVFSGHKMYAPFGVGCIVGRFQNRQLKLPLLWGGGMVEWVEDSAYQLEQDTSVFEGGTQNLIGILALQNALFNLNKVGFRQIAHHEQVLKEKLICSMRCMKNVIVYGDVVNSRDRLGVITFNIKGRTYMDIAGLLADQYGIATRCGKFCAHPYVDRLLVLDKHTSKEVPSYYGEQGMVRISLGLYNTAAEVDEFLNIVEHISRS